MTDEAVDDYYVQLKKLHRKSYESYKAFTYDHTDEHAEFTVHMIHHLPNGEDRKQTVVMNKQKLMESLPDSYKFSQGAKVQHKLIDTEVAADGTYAILRNMTFITTVVGLPTAKGSVKVDVSTQIKCEDHLISDPIVAVKVDKSECTSESFFFLPEAKKSPANPPPSSPKSSEDKK